MGSTVFPAASAASKTMFRTTLTSGTSYTVPANVTYLNVTLMGGGGGAGGTGGNGYGSKQGGAGELISSTLSATAGASIAYAIGAGGAGGSANGTAGGTTTFTGATSAVGGGGGSGGTGSSGYAGKTGYATNGGGDNGDATSSTGGAGGAGCIYVEYWAQEIIMNRVFAVIENNKVTNIIVGVEPEVVAANPEKYIEYTDGWTYPEGIDGGIYFPEVTE